MYVFREHIDELTEATYIYGDVYVPVLCAMVHGFLQGFKFGLPRSDQVDLRWTSTFQLRTLCKNLLQGQDVPLARLCMRQQLTKHISKKKKGIKDI